MALAARAWLALTIVSLASSCTSLAAPDQALQVWRMDCGRFDIVNFEGRGPLAMPSSCYLVRDGDELVMFDAGLPAELLGSPLKQEDQTITLDRTLAAQFAGAGIDPADIDTLVVSHYHADHLSQADLFINATLIIGEGDRAKYESVKNRGAVTPWFEGKRPLRTISVDTPLTRSGRVVGLVTPGHTPGHLSLLVRAPGNPIILTGDLVAQREQLASGEPSEIHVDKAQGRAQIARVVALAKRERARIVVGHDLRDSNALPSTPLPIVDPEMLVTTPPVAPIR